MSVVPRGTDDYPPALGDIPDPPNLLYVQGKIEPADQIAIALVGSRKCTPYGLRVAERLATSLARVGITVVSGLARGIDAAAHRGALAGGGRTIAVLANGLAEIYPPEHENPGPRSGRFGGVDQRVADDPGPLGRVISAKESDHFRDVAGRGWWSRRPLGAGRCRPPGMRPTRTGRFSPCRGRWTACRAGGAIA